MRLHILLILYIILTIGNINASFIFDQYAGTHLFVLLISYILLLHYILKNTLLESLYPIRYFLIIVFVLLSYSVLLSSNFSSGIPKLLGLCATALFAIYVAKNIYYDEFVKILIEAGFFVALMTFLMVALIPDIVIDNNLHIGDWKGIYDHKNVFGYFSLLYFSACWFSLLFIHRSKNWTLLNLVVAFILIFYSGSKTSFAISILMIFIGLLGYLRIRYKFQDVLGILIVIGLVLFTYGLYSNNIFVGALGSNNDYISIYSIKVPLTGRLTIWDFCLEALSKKPLFGYGYGGFWGVNENSDIYGYGLGEFNLNDAHNGFVDLFLSVGIVSASIMLITLAYYFFQIYRFYLKNILATLGFFYVYFFILFILINLTESVLLKATNFYQFLLFYIIFNFIYEKYRKKNIPALNNIKQFNINKNGNVNPKKIQTKSI